MDVRADYRPPAGAAGGKRRFAICKVAAGGSVRRIVPATTVSPPHPMTADHALFRRQFVRAALLLALCAGLLPLAACKKKDPAAASGEAAPAGEQPAEQAPKEEPPVGLKAKWPAEQRLVVRNETVTETEVSNPGLPQPVKTENVLVQEIAFTPGKEREGGGNEVEVHVLSVRSETRAGGKSIVTFDPAADAKQDAKSPLAPTYRKLIGARVKFHTGADGKVEKVDGVPQLLSKLSAGATPQARFLISGLVNEDSIKGWNTLHLGLPTEPVKPGDTWESSRDIPFGITKFNLTGTNTFKGWEQRGGRKLAKIEFAGAIAAKEGAGGPITLGDGSSVTGNAWYDPALGVIVEGDSTSQFSINVAQATGQTSSSKLKAKVSSKLTEPAVSSGAPAVAESPAAAPGARPGEAKSPAPKAAAKP